MKQVSVVMAANHGFIQHACMSDDVGLLLTFSEDNKTVSGMRLWQRQLQVDKTILYMYFNQSFDLNSQLL